MKSYSTYDPVDFAQDASFIRWVRHSSKKDRLFWENWLKSHPEKSADIEEARLLVAALSFTETEPEKSTVDGLWNKIDEEISREEGRKRIVRLPTLWRYAVAASVAFLLIFQLLWRKTNHLVAAENAEWISHTLPDRSVVELNAGSTLDYNRAKWKEERLVELNGEAFFKVERGEKFTVVAPGGKVEVLGTSFNVFARGDQFRVECFTGSVKVTLAPGVDRTLSPGKAVRRYDNELVLSDLESTGMPAWVDGNFPYPDATYREVFEEIERQFDVVIEVDEATKQKHYQGVFNRNWSLDKVLYEVGYTNGLTAEINGKKVLIKEQ